MARKNLVIIYRGPEYQQDFDDIASRIIALDREITVYHLPATLAADLPLTAWAHPTLTIAMVPEFKLEIRRGPVLRSRPFGKREQYASFRSNGIQTPPTAAFAFGMRLDPIMFGEYVLMKPGNWIYSSEGRGIHVFHRTVAERLEPANFPAGHVIHAKEAEYTVQRFIDTGIHPQKFRALTFLGRVLYISHEVNREPRPELSRDLSLASSARFHTANTVKTFEPNHRVKAFAEAVAACFPDLPLLGIDVIEGSDGRLHALEINAGGNVWHFSSGMWAERRSQDPSLLIRMKSQYGAFDVAAGALVERVQALAS